MSDRISPTAHYTAAVWAHHGLSHPALATVEGRLLHTALRPTLAAMRLLGAPTLDAFLLARHRLIDFRLEEAIAAGRVGQVVELAAGLSPRGWRFGRRHGDAVTYVETDLPGMARRKREALERAGGEHRVADLDALADDGPDSLDALAGTLDPARGVAIVTEGLLNYFDRPSVEGLWARIARTLRRFPDGLYLSDLHLAATTSGPLVQAFSAGLSAFVRGRVHLHFADEAEASGALAAAGFDQATLLRPRDFAGRVPGCEDERAQVVRVVEATV